MDKEEMHRFVGELIFVGIALAMLTGAIGVSCIFIAIQPFNLFGLGFGFLMVVVACWIVACVIPKLEEVQRVITGDNSHGE